MSASKGSQQIEVNVDSLLKAASKEALPPTEDLAADDGGNDFVTQKSRNRRGSKASLGKEDSPIAKSVPRRFSLPRRFKRNSCSAVDDDFKERNLFVDKIPLKASKDDLFDVFSRFGNVTDVYISRKPHQHDEFNYAFVSFKSESEAKAALSTADEDGVFLNTSRIRVAKRRNSAGQVPSWQKLISQQKVDSPKIKHEPGSEWMQVVDGFDWRHTVACYLFREVTMEQYFREFVHTLASFKSLTMECASDLTENLIFLSENCPRDVNEMMPPSVSGLVYNQNQENYFDVAAILQQDKNLFRIDTNHVHYLNTVPSDKARLNLKHILLKGVFVYFFAKFSHGAHFSIKYSYYLKSEPIRSALMAVTGLADVVQALKAFFAHFKEVFAFNDKICELRLTYDFYHKNQRENMKKFLNKDANGNNACGVGLTSNVESSDSWEEMALSPDTDTVLPFFMDPDHEHRNLLGQVRGSFSENSGIVEFQLHGGTEEAFFCARDVYINGKAIGSLWSNLQVGSEVYLDVEEDQPGRCFKYRAQLVWVGEKPNHILSGRRMSVDGIGLEQQHHHSDLTRHLYEDLDRFLDPAEVTQSIKSPPSFDFPSDMEDLPNSVQSVVFDVLKDDHSHNILSNPTVIDDCLSRLEASGFPGLTLEDRNELKIRMETEYRQVFAKYLAEKCFF